MFSSEATRRIVESGIHSRATEAGFAALSLMMVALGWFLADTIYRREALSADRISASFGGLYTLVLNKYYVDEIYQAAIVNPYLALTRACAWFDLHIIDGVVNLVATISVLVAGVSDLFDHLRGRRAGESGFQRDARRRRRACDGSRPAR